MSSGKGVNRGGQPTGGQSAQAASGSAPGSGSSGQNQGRGDGPNNLVDHQNAGDPGSLGSGAVVPGNAQADVEDVPSQDLSAREAALAARFAALEAAEAELAEQRRDIAEREEQLKTDLASRGRALLDEKEAFKGPDGGYRFEVGAVNFEKYPTLKPIVVVACDESEAKRFFCATKQDPDKPGKQVDPVKIDIMARCVDPRRQEAMNRALALAAIRRKRENGQPLSEQEEALLSLSERALPI